MLEEYQAESQQVQDSLHHAYEVLEELRTRLGESYPPEERTYRMGQAMQALGDSSSLILQAHTRLQGIEWPTEERPR